ncbi:MAG: UvrD-helicase domain-containing protein [Pseudomonadota bacterium]
MSRSSNAFDLLSTPLKGINLIEANAGTGKTYAITSLFVRLVIEKKMAVDEILVVTFTEAATTELKRLIRSRIKETINAFQQGSSADAFLNSFAIKFQASKKEALASLDQAFRDFDQSAIYTIHGFCRRMLCDNAFESGGMFEIELEADQDKIKQEVAEDFWRKKILNESSLFIQYLIDNKITPRHLAGTISTPALPYLTVIPASSSFEKGDLGGFQVNIKVKYLMIS